MRKPPVVVLSGVRWNFLWQRHQSLSMLFARAGYPTVFVETTGLANPSPNLSAVRKVVARLRGSRASRKILADGPAVYPPLVLPPTTRVFRRINRAFFLPRVVCDLRDICGEAPVVVAYPPTRTTLDLIEGLNPRLVLYDRADDYRYFPGAPGDVAATERELLARADLVSCTSTPLLEGARRLRSDAFLNGPAVDYERFAPLRDYPPAVPPRTVCFFGHAGRERVDFDVLRAIARAGFRIRLVGAMDRAGRDFSNEPNVEHAGEVVHAELPAALSGVDAFVLPYKVNGLTRGISPAKTYECLATGRPVVATPLPALKALTGHVYLANGPGEHVEILRNLGRTETREKVRARTRLAHENSWDTRFAQLEGAVLQELEENA